MKPAEKIQSLTRYVNDLQNRLAAPITAKHASHAEYFKDYLKLEITKATRSIEKLKTKV
jgi:flagellar biosynthesis chaperone FliJ